MRWIVVLVCLVGCDMATDGTATDTDAEAFLGRVPMRLQDGGATDTLQDARPDTQTPAQGTDVREGAADTRTDTTAPGRPVGAACSAPTDCDSGFCVGTPGRCCNRACNSPCEACGTGYCEAANEGGFCGQGTCDGRTGTPGVHSVDPAATVAQNHICSKGACVTVTAYCRSDAFLCAPGNQLSRTGSGCFYGEDGTVGCGAEGPGPTCKNGTTCQYPQSRFGTESGVCK